MSIIIEKILDPIEPDEQVPEYRYDGLDLGESTYGYRLFWNDRAERWQIDIYDGDGNALIQGKRLVSNWPLMHAHTGRAPTGGQLILLDTGDIDGRDECTYEGLGWRWRLVWATGAPDAVTRYWTIELVP